MVKTKSYPIHKDEVWIKGNEEDNTSLSTVGVWGLSFVTEIARVGKTDPFWMILEFRRGHFVFLIPEDYTRKQSEKLFTNVRKNPKSYNRLRRDLIRTCNEMYRASEKILLANLASVTNSELLALYNNFYKAFRDHAGYAMTSTLIDIPNVLFTNYALDILDKCVNEKRLKKSVQEYFEILSSVTEDSIQRREARHVLKILRLIQRDKKYQKIFSKSPKQIVQELRSYRLWIKIYSHLRKYNWAYFGYIGPAMKEADIIDEIKRLIKEKVSAEKELRKMTHEIKKIPVKIKKAEKELGLTKYEREFFGALRNTISMKIYRKDAETFGFYALSFYLAEVARRAGITIAEANYIASWEYPKVLKRDKRFLKDLKKRTGYCVLIANTTKPYILSGKEAEAFTAKINRGEKVKKVSEFTGQVACLGKAKGKVKIIHTAPDMVKMNKGDILVSMATTPEVVPAMKKASAIVTEQGGITSHAAIVSRELNIPCVIGTKIATRALKDGDRVEVDANKGVIRKI